jgi:hypothetical protein
MKHRLLLIAALTPTLCLAQIKDAPPVDTHQLIEALRAVREQHVVTHKSRKQATYQQVMTAAASGQSASTFWKQSVKVVQFEGADNQASKVSDWEDGDGDALNSKECQNAARLHLYWLGLSLQHSMGTETRQILQSIIEFTSQVRANEDAMAKLEIALERAKERKDKQSLTEYQAIKRVHDSILKTPVNNSSVSRWLQISDLLNSPEIKPELNSSTLNNKPMAPRGWELTPGNAEGIFINIILPEFRFSKDPRLLEYWDARIKQGAERVAEKKLEIEQRDWDQIKRPSLLWARAEDMKILGLKNRALNEMINLVKTYPQHPNIQSWIYSIEAIIAPPTATTTMPALSITPQESH